MSLGIVAPCVRKPFLSALCVGIRLQWMSFWVNLIKIFWRGSTTTRNVLALQLQLMQGRAVCTAGSNLLPRRRRNSRGMMIRSSPRQIGSRDRLWTRRGAIVQMLAQAVRAAALGKRPSLLIGERPPLMIGERPPLQRPLLMLGKRPPLMLGKRPPLMLGKRPPLMLGTLVLGKLTLGKRPPLKTVKQQAALCKRAPLLTPR